MYTIVFLLSLLISIVMENYHSENYFHKDTDSNLRIKKSFFVVVFLSIILYAALIIAPALRDKVGTDYIVYSNKQIPEVLQGIPNSVEYLYKGVIHLGNMLGNYQWIFVLTHVIIFLFILMSILRDSKNYWLSIIVLFGTGFFNYSMNIMRQSIAIAIFLFSIHYLLKRENKKYILCIIIAMLFHKTSILYFMLLVLRNTKLQWKKIAIFSIGLIIFKEVFRSIMLMISTRFNFYDNQFGTVLDSRQVGWVFMIANGVILFLYLMINRKKVNSDRTNVYILLQFIAFAITLISDVVPNYERLMYMFMIAQILSVPYFYKLLNSRVFKWGFLLVLVLVYSLLFYRLFIISNIGETFPYKSILN
ncbi:transmembrane protein EpsG [Enterococcus sp. DIV0840]|uniref:EpsG family protein n=1 Tax=Enterococcus TaxID=1350 RepID=UPI001A8E8948|nr:MULTISPECIES: EpsG family protein [Enterococcus]MBO0434085.1 EpsG family protein [Enterococcus sp. DIV0849a]MBO0472990.1 EpsG family protein [Enterococcus ureasiticus]